VVRLVPECTTAETEPETTEKLVTSRHRMLAGPIEYHGELYTSNGGWRRPTGDENFIDNELGAAERNMKSLMDISVRILDPTSSTYTTSAPQAQVGKQ
jgi:hypothetical protein